MPDPAAIRLYLVPDSAPPYDDEIPGGAPGNGRLPAWAPAVQALSSGERGPGEAAHAEGQPGEPGSGEPARGAPAGAGAPPGWPNRFAQVLAETLGGARPPRQMVPWTTREALRRIERLSPRLASAQRPRVRRVLSSAPAADVMELAVVVGFGPQVRALAVRLERAAAGARPGQGEWAPGCWVCTAVEAA